VISPTQGPLPDYTQHSQEKNIHTLGGFETTIPAIQLPQTHAVDRVATGSPKGTAKPTQAYCRPLSFQEFEAPRFLDNGHMKVVRPSILRIGRLYPPGNILGTYICQRLSRPPRHSAAGRNIHSFYCLSF